MSKHKPEIALSEMDELGMTKQVKKVSIAAWALSAFVIIAGIAALVLTGKKLFILFIILGILTPLNVLAYDNLVLKPKVARLKAEREAAAELERREAADAAAKEYVQ